MRLTPVRRVLAGLGAAGTLLVTAASPAAAAPVDFDFVAQGARITGVVGDQAQVKLGFHNQGPATVDRRNSAGDVSVVDIALPKGTTAVTVPAECQPGAAGAYRCSPGPVATSGQTITFPFVLRIDSAEVAPGSVTINVRCQCDSDNVDANAGNDTAPIEVVVNTVVATSAAGGGLPISGGAAGVILGAGGLLLLAGVVGAVVAGRRRARPAG
ncbi:hypothetical protein [Asanoa iriomotensis]|uniref:LPXTG-motif cell wall anchor domain-containing protein n=1 Tax=Asanoa iriomotensis TaxID=234613 RepID=A0ABQ4C848_9ACTN|nr:hypothetical protein [Asanoa iriomotensis]GIF58510.1 hypothetical protein Air01nite_46050 [Asanoa iriomotensis]